MANYTLDKPRGDIVMALMLSVSKHKAHRLMLDMHIEEDGPENKAFHDNGCTLHAYIIDELCTKLEIPTPLDVLQDRAHFDPISALKRLEKMKKEQEVELIDD
jgi:hypothetical protein